jgi:transcriptional regulator with XRE-family HTH domain
METRRAARSFRAVRLHLGLRQRDVAARAGVSQQHVSDLERGKIGSMTADELGRIFNVLDMRAVITVQWRGGQLDRLLDEGHAALGVACAELFASLGWEVLPEVTFSFYGERGSIDVLAWHSASRTLLVIELKSEITSAEETIRRHDAKVRLAAQIGQERFGAKAEVVARLLVVADTSGNRARVKRLDPLFMAPYPRRGRAVREWLARPSGEMGGVLFLNTAARGANSVTPTRIRRPRR